VPSPLEQALTELQSANDKVQSLLERATEQRLYAEIAALARIAQSISILITQMTGDSPQPASKTSFHVEQLSSPSRSVNQIQYPRFLVQDDCLVKVAWSSAKSASYEHRAPIAVLRAIAKRAVMLNQRSPKPFTAEALSDISRQHDDQEVRGYQLYLCLGWLRREHLIRQHGRRGYRITDDEEPFLDAIDRKVKHLSANPQETE
jgi:hypothetical protein